MYALTFVFEVIGSDIFTATPSNLAIVAGKPLILECRVALNSTILWYYYATSIKAAGVIIYNGEKFSNKFVGDFSVDMSTTGQHDLVAKKTRLEHAGFYECVALERENSSVQKHSAKAQLIVLGMQNYVKLLTTNCENLCTESFF